MAPQDPRPPLPVDPLECRHKAEQLLAERDASPAEKATGWALLAIAGELAAIRRQLGKSKARG
jgi:hypothetical protein